MQKNCQENLKQIPILLLNISGQLYETPPIHCRYNYSYADLPFKTTFNFTY